MKSALHMLQQHLGDRWLMQNAPFPTGARPYSQPTIPAGNEPTSGFGFPSEPGSSLSGGFPTTNRAGQNTGMLSQLPPPRGPMPPEVAKRFAESNALAQMQAWWNETQRPQAMQGAPQDPFSSPLNQMLQRPPFGLY